MGYYAEAFGNSVLPIHHTSESGDVELIERGIALRTFQKAPICLVSTGEPCIMNEAWKYELHPHRTEADIVPLGAASSCIIQ